MKVQVKQNGGSLIIIIPHNVVKFMGIKEGDWVDISDIVVLKRDDEKELEE